MGAVCTVMLTVETQVSTVRSWCWLHFSCLRVMRQDSLLLGRWDDRENRCSVTDAVLMLLHRNSTNLAIHFMPLVDVPSLELVQNPTAYFLVKTIDVLLSHGFLG